MSLSHRMLGSQPGHHAGIIHNPRTYEMLANLQFLGKRRRIWRQFRNSISRHPRRESHRHRLRDRLLRRDTRTHRG